MKSFRIAVTAAAILLAPSPMASLDVAQDSVLMQALRDELARSMEELQLEDAEKPYFLAYRVFETATGSAVASLGGLLQVNEGRTRQLWVELRVGDYDFDNTNFVSMRNPSAMLPVVTQLAVDDDYDALRRQIWLATDTAYKRALDQLAGKRAALQNKTQVEEVADFTREEPFQFDGWTGSALDASPARDLAVDVSAAMQGLAHLSRSEVRVVASLDRTWFVNSEGSAFVRETPFVGFYALAATQADDGAELQDAVFVWVDDWADMPDVETLTADVHAMASRLEQRRQSPVAERYVGPVLFEDQAAAELVTRVLGPRLIAIRLPTPDNPQMEQAMAQLRNPFLDKIGSRVLPRFLSIVTDPTIAAHEGIPLRGAQPVDDDGVPTRRMVLVERGILKTLLSTRVPLAEVPRTSGSRWRDSPVPSNFLIEPTRGMSAEELKEELFLLAEDRGLDHAVVVRRIGTRLATLDSPSRGFFGRQASNVEPLIGVYKVYPDGSEERIRTASISTFSESDFKDIVAVSDTTTYHETGFSPAPPGVPATGPIWPIAVITPALLFEDVTIRRPPGNIRKPPVTPHPLAKR
ncbi:MAG: metallopeptidase TldD-related protein [Gammaproteobacteria bacterium]|nr:metallopeptidase TldD-related protein [Gammaproteobacteria bacterium]